MQSLTAPAGTPAPPAAMKAWVCQAYGGTEVLALKLGADQALDYRQHSPASLPRQGRHRAPAWLRGGAGDAGGRGPHGPTREPDMRRSSLAFVALLAFAGASALAEDAVERKFIRTGMGEGEVLFKIGKPDHEAMVRSVRGEPEEKTWTYFPHPRDPQTLTVLTFHAGVVTRIDRKIAR
jgi:hypothetical protein